MCEADNNSLSEHISPDNYSYDFLVPSKKDGFSGKPWLKPRKQWLRSNQWKKEISVFIDNLRLTDRPLTYLSLPGEDLLDFRIVSDLCKQKTMQHPRLVGFNNPNHITPINNNKLKTFKDIMDGKLAQIPSAPSSDIHYDSFNLISDEKSVAYQFANQKGPYDIINLDLCDSFSGVNEKESYYKATLNLINLQTKSRTEPWMFLLTTRADKRKVNLDDTPNFWQNIKLNSTKSVEFKNSLKNFLNQEYDQIINIKEFMNNLPSPFFEKLFSLFLSKWLLGIIRTQQKWTIKLIKSYCYRTKSASRTYPNMFSLGFLFEPFFIPHTDPTNLSPANEQQNYQFDESQQALTLLKEILKIVDLDCYLKKNPAEFDRAIREAESLLEKIDYNITDYKNWAIQAQNEIDIST